MGRPYTGRISTAVPGSVKKRGDIDGDGEKQPYDLQRKIADRPDHNEWARSWKTPLPTGTKAQQDLKGAGNSSRSRDCQKICRHDGYCGPFGTGIRRR